MASYYMDHERKEMKFLFEMPVFSYSFDCFSAQMCWSHLYCWLKISTIIISVLHKKRPASHLIRTIIQFIQWPVASRGSGQNSGQGQQPIKQVASR